jgi:hypothetical protein
VISAMPSWRSTCVALGAKLPEVATHVDLQEGIAEITRELAALPQ